MSEIGLDPNAISLHGLTIYTLGEAKQNEHWVIPVKVKICDTPDNALGVIVRNEADTAYEFVPLTYKKKLLISTEV